MSVGSASKISSELERLSLLSRDQLVETLTQEVVRLEKLKEELRGGNLENQYLRELLRMPIVAAGISGINIEDGTDEPALLAKKIEAIKKMFSSAGVDVLVNARTDVYLQDLVADNKKVRETLDRAATYQEAGADGLFVPGLTETAHIAEITKGTGLPINLMSSSELPKMDALAKLNVRRLSTGTAIAQIACKHVARLAENFLKEGDCGVFNEDAMQYSQLQNLFEGRE